MKLLAPFDPTNTQSVPFPANQKFNWKEMGVSFTSDIRKPFNWLISSRYGGYYDGTRATTDAENYIIGFNLMAVLQLFHRITISPCRHPIKAQVFSHRTRLDITFTDKIFLTSLVQYNNQIDNINLNLRFQWRFAPVSDLFIVYTENSFPADNRIKNRGLVLKLSYWFN